MRIGQLRRLHTLRRSSMLAVAAVMAFALAVPVHAQSSPELKVVVTSKPIHSLVAMVMRGLGTPHLLVDGAASPHSYAMKPSDARKIHDSDIFFRVSEGLEPFTEKVLAAIPQTVVKVTLAESEGVVLLARRSGGAFEAHAHSRLGTSGERHAHSDAAGIYDAHVWLDTDNAKAMTRAIASALATRYPLAAAQIAQNARTTVADIDRLADDLDRDLAPVRTRPFVVLHDAYQYFERRFGLTGVGSITIAPDIAPSARRLSEVRAKVRTLAAVCVFSEPPAPSKLIAGVIEGTRATVGVLDPEGLSLPPGPDLYAQLMRHLARDLKTCLASPA